MAAASSPAALLKSPSQVSLLWQRLFEVGRAAALPARLRLLEATQAARLAVITALQDPDWLGEASSSGASSAVADSLVNSAMPGGSAAAGANATPGPAGAGAAGWWERLPAAPANGFSKNGEDGILSYIFEHVHVTNKFYVDLGADAGHGSNTEMLRKVGWRGWLINRENQNQATGMYLEKLFPGNVMAVFNKYKMPRLVDLLVIDLDSNEAHVLHALWQAGVRPRVVMIETNNNFGEDSVLSFPAGYKFLTHQWTSCGQVCTRILDSGQYQRVICGASVRGLARMAELFDYFPTYLNKMNLFLIRGDLVPKAMRKTWTFDDVLKRSRGLGRKALPFPRKECMPFMDGLVPLVEPSPAAAKATPDAAKPTAAAKLPGAATKPAPAVAKPAPDAKAAIAAAVAEVIAKALAAAKPQPGAAEAGKAKTEKPPGGQKDEEASPRWRGLLMDCCNDNLTMGLHKEDVSPQSIISLFTKHKVHLPGRLPASNPRPRGQRPLRERLGAQLSRQAHTQQDGGHRRSSSPCGPVCTFAGERGAQQAVLCGAGAHGMFLLAKSAAYYSPAGGACSC